MTSFLARSSRLAASGLAAAVLLALASCSSGNAVPYQDKQSIGLIALYGKDGKPQTSGKVADKPFVASAVSQAKAPAPYDKEGRKATLLAYQPRKNADAAQWNGKFLTGANTYPDVNHPTVRVPDQALSLAQFLSEYPAQWDGLVQLRIYLGAPGEPTLNSTYASADIKVKGDTWTLVRGATSNALGVTRGTNLWMLSAAQPSEGVPITVIVENSVSPSPTDGGQGGGGPLPRTGADIVRLAGVGLMLVVAGTAAVVLGRRRFRPGSGDVTNDEGLPT